MIVSELNNEEVETADDISELLSEELNTFCEHLWDQEGMTRLVDENDSVDPDNTQDGKLWTLSACVLIEAEEKRLHDIGQKYFPGEDTPVECGMYVSL